MLEGGWMLKYVYLDDYRDSINFLCLPLKLGLELLTASGGFVG